MILPSPMLNIHPSVPHIFLPLAMLMSSNYYIPLVHTLYGNYGLENKNKIFRVSRIKFFKYDKKNFSNKCDSSHLFLYLIIFQQSFSTICSIKRDFFGLSVHNISSMTKLEEFCNSLISNFIRNFSGWVGCDSFICQL